MDWLWLLRRGLNYLPISARWCRSIGPYDYLNSHHAGAGLFCHEVQPASLTFLRWLLPLSISPPMMEVNFILAIWISSTMMVFILLRKLPQGLDWKQASIFLQSAFFEKPVSRLLSLSYEGPGTSNNLFLHQDLSNNIEPFGINSIQILRSKTKCLLRWIPSRRAPKFLFSTRLAKIVINTQVSGNCSEVNTSRLSSGGLSIHVDSQWAKDCENFPQNSEMIYVNGKRRKHVYSLACWTRPFRKRCVRNGAILAWCPWLCWEMDLGRTGHHVALLARCLCSIFP